MRDLMSGAWCVLLDTGKDMHVYGPMNFTEADAFAKYMTATVDPATPRPMRSPTGEMLTWWQHEQDRNNCSHGADCMVHPDASGVHQFENPVTPQQKEATQ